MKPSVVSQPWVSPTSSARSLVIEPASTVSTQTFSRVSAKWVSSALPSSLARCFRPWVQAKIEAIELVEVDSPRWCWRKWRVTVPWAASDSMILPSGVISTEVIRPSEPKPWATWSDCTSPS